jgi:hypothetical protein
MTEESNERMEEMSIDELTAELSDGISGREERAMEMETNTITICPENRRCLKSLPSQSYSVIRFTDGVEITFADLPYLFHCLKPGWEAFAQGKRLTQNPYSRGTDMFNQWREGWKDAERGY